jgi:hypothetical protein
VLVVNKERNIKRRWNWKDREMVKREEGGRDGMGRVKEKMQGKEGRGEEMEETNIEVKDINELHFCLQYDAYYKSV